MVGKVAGVVWRMWEHSFHKVFGLEPIKPGEEHLFFIAKRTYLGRRFTVDGMVVKPFDKVIELHMNNDLLAEVLRSESQLVGIAVRLINEAKKSFPLLAEAISQKQFASISVVYGVTFIHRGIQRFGFQALPVRSKWSRNLTRWHLRNVMRMVNPDAIRILEAHPEAFDPMLVAASKSTIISRFGAESRREEATVSVGDHCLT